MENLWIKYRNPGNPGNMGGKRKLPRSTVTYRTVVQRLAANPGNERKPYKKKYDLNFI